MNSLEKLSGFVSKYMAVFVIVVAAIALFEPASFKWSASYITILLGVVMFGMVMTTTILAPIVTPLLTWWLAGAWIEISLSAMMLSILKMVVAPIVLGIVLNTLFRSTVEKVVKVLPLVSVVSIVLIVGGVVAVSSQRILETGALIMVVVMLHNLLGYSCGFAIGKLLKMDIAKAKAVSIEVGMQNSGLATSLAMLHFGAAAAIPGAIFSVWHNISGSLAANYLAARMNKETLLEDDSEDADSDVAIATK
ncbi:MAG: bile acid:sodium symporter [Selenomonadaceae bacterium]|nr:bile acid:sodium symporter [Selenomonadaceae bacterium]